MARIGVGTVTITDIFDGARGAGWFYFTGSVWNTANADSVTPGDNVLNDVVTISNNSTFTETRYWTGVWSTFTKIIDGSLVVTQTLAANAIVANSISTAQLDVTTAFMNDLFAVDVTVGGVLTVQGSAYNIVMQGGNNVSPFYIAKAVGGEQVFGIDSLGELYFEGAIAAGSIRSINAFTQNVYDQLVPTVTSQTGGADFMVDNTAVVSGTAYSPNLSINPCNTTNVTVSVTFKDSDYYLGSLAGLPGWTASRWTILIERSVNGGVFDPIDTITTTGTHYVYEETSQSEEGYTTNINIVYEDSTHGGNNVPLLYRFKATWVSGSINSPKWRSGSIGQAIQGGSALNIATANQLGGIKVGDGLAIDAGTGVLSASGGSAAEILTLLKTVDVNGTAGVNAGTCDGYEISPVGTVNNIASKVMTTHANGYTYVGWLNTVSGVTTGTPIRIYCSQDSFLRYYSPSALAPYILNQGSTKNTHTHTFASLTSTPTTLSGYGITDGGSVSVDASPVDASVNAIASNWAYDHSVSSSGHPRDTRSQVAGTYIVNGTGAGPRLSSTYLTFIYSSSTNVDHIGYNDTSNTYHFNADIAYTNTSANAIVNAATLQEGGVNLSTKYAAYSHGSHTDTLYYDGNGITQSGTTFTLGTPLTITDSSTNSIGASNHGHLIDHSSTTIRGIVQLSTSVISDSITIAATSSAVKAAYDRSWPNTLYYDGNGITQSGTTFTLGTPGTTTISTSNAVTASGHTHAFTGNCANPNIVQTTITGRSGVTDAVRISDAGSITVLHPSMTTGSGATQTNYRDTTFVFNAFTNRLTVPLITATLTGSSTSCTGNAATATTASRLAVNSGNSSNSFYNILWHSGNYVYSSTALGLNGYYGRMYATVFRENGTDLVNKYALIADCNLTAPLSITSSGKIYDVGSLNTGWCHMNTTATSGFYMYDPLSALLLTSRGNVTAVGSVYSSFSDIRLKDVTGVPKKNMDAINKWEPIIYTANDLAVELSNGVYDKETVEIGISAQSVEATHPELVNLAAIDMMGNDETDFDPKVSKSKENYLTLNYSRLTSILVGALQEKDLEIQDLKERMTTLEALVERYIITGEKK